MAKRSAGRKWRGSEEEAKQINNQKFLKNHKQFSLFKI